DKLNAFTFTMMNEVIDAFDHADADDDVRAVVVTGAGRGFCAGADLAAGDGTFDYRDSSGSEAKLEDARDGGGLVALRIFESTKPLTADSSAACTHLTSCCPRPTPWRGRSPTTQRRCRSPSPATCCGGCWAPTIPWRRTSWTRASSGNGAARPTPRRA